MAASFRIHEDQENITLDSRKTSNTMHANQRNIDGSKECYGRREVLGLISNKLNTNLGDPHLGMVEMKKRKPLSTVLSVSQNYAPVHIENSTINKETLKHNLYSSPKTNVTDDVVIKHQENESKNKGYMSVSDSISESKMKDQLTIENEPDILVYVIPEYKEDIRKYLFVSQRKHRPHPRYMCRQPELTDQMRAILIDWLVSVSDEYRMTSYTLHLAVGYIDRFLSKMSVVRSKLQLVGVTAMMIAAKYEEIYPPDVAEFAFLTSETYSTRQLIRMEQLILRVLSFDLVTPTIQTFIDEYVICCGENELIHKMAMYISELCLVESTSILQFLPSEIAAGCVALARLYLGNGNTWPKSLVSISGYSLKDLTVILRTQQKIYEESPTKVLQAVNTKYRAKRFMEVSTLKPIVLKLED